MLWVELWVGILGTIPSNSLKRMAGTTGLEPAASAVTGQRSNQLNYVPGIDDRNFRTGGQCRTRTCDLLLVRQAL